MQALIVEPSRFLRSVLTSIFSTQNIATESFGSAEEALDKLKWENPDLLCFSQQLENLNGVEFFLRVKGVVNGNPPVALMVTSDLSSGVRAEAARAGITECFNKNRLEELENFVKRYADQESTPLTGRVLLVEDSPITVKICAEVISGIGLQHDVFESAEAAQAAFASGNYDLVLTDYLLTGEGTGMSLIRYVRSFPDRKGMTSILAMSSLSDSSRKIEILRAGANDFVVKPFIKEELEVRIRNLVIMKQLFDRLHDQHMATKELAMRDPLTSLHNRYYLMEQVPTLFEKADTAARPMALMVIDIDHFKKINDTLGHAVGDAVLVAIADVLRTFCRNDVQVVRYGGEEFVMLIPGFTLAQAQSGAERIRQKIESLNPIGPSITASFGVAERRGKENFDDLFRRADACVYKAKANGRNQVIAE